MRYGALTISRADGSTVDFGIDQVSATVGRGPANALSIDDPSLDQRHARIAIEGGNLLVEDLGSRAGVFVNGLRIPPNTPTVVPDNGTVRFGNVSASFRPPVAFGGRSGGGAESVAPSPSRRGIELSLTPTRVSAGPGSTAYVRVEIANTSTVVDQVRIELQGLDPGWLELPEDMIRLLPGERAERTIAITPPGSEEARPRGRPFTVRALSAASAGEAIAQGALEVTLGANASTTVPTYPVYGAIGTDDGRAQPVVSPPRKKSRVLAMVLLPALLIGLAAAAAAFLLLANGNDVVSDVSVVLFDAQGEALAEGATVAPGDELRVCISTSEATDVQIQLTDAAGNVRTESLSGVLGESCFTIAVNREFDAPGSWTLRLTGDAGELASTSFVVDGLELEVFFVDAANVQRGEQPFVRAVSRSVPHVEIDPGVARNILQHLFAGPTDEEQDDDLVLVTSGATGVADLQLSQGVLSVQLVGGCDRGDLPVTIADQIIPTVKQFNTVDFVKVFDPNGTTLEPAGFTDSIPACLAE